MARAKTLAATTTALASWLLTFSQGHAEEVPPGHEPYVGMSVGYAKPDEDVRGADSGYGVQLLFGWKLSEHWNAQVSSSYFNYETGDGAVSDFYRSALGVDLMWLPRREGWSPYLLAGVGAAHNDMYPSADDGVSLTASAGLGLMSRPIGNYGIRVRAEGRYVLDRFGGDPKDVHAFVGFDVPLRRRAQTIVRVETKEVVREVVREAPPAPPAPPPPPPVDSDRDGVFDPQDRCPDTLPGTRVDAQGCAIESSVVTLQGVHFQTGSARLSHESTAILMQAAAALKGQPSMRVEVRGHTDSVGTDENNQKLSQDRASSVVEFLASNGIDRSRLMASGYGEAQPVADNATAEGRASNRRVEFRVISR